MSLGDSFSRAAAWVRAALAHFEAGNTVLQRKGVVLAQHHERSKKEQRDGRQRKPQARNLGVVAGHAHVAPDGIHYHNERKWQQYVVVQRVVANGVFGGHAELKGASKRSGIKPNEKTPAGAGVFLKKLVGASGRPTICGLLFRLSFEPSAALWRLFPALWRLWRKGCAGCPLGGQVHELLRGHCLAVGVGHGGRGFGAAAVAAIGQHHIFDLHRAVVDVKLLEQPSRQVGEPGGIGAAGAHEVGHEGGIVAVAAHAPDVQVVQALHAGPAQHKLPHLLQINAIGHGLQAQPDGVAQQAPRADSNDDQQPEADDRVEPRPTRVVGNGPAHHHAQTHQGIGEHVQVGPAHVHVALLPGPEQPGREAINGNACAGQQHHRAALHGLGVAQVVDGFPQDEAQRPVE
nr:hypothetical protein [Tanacetum cinerariifolium]